MKSYFLLAFVFTVTQAVSHGYRGTSLANFGRSRFVEQRLPHYSTQSYGIRGRPEYSETYHQESGNIYGGQRDGRIFSRNSGGNVRGFQYSTRRGNDYSGSRDQYGSFQNQQSRFQDGVHRGSYGYGAGRNQISFNAPLANTRSYNAQFDAAGNRNFGYY